MESGTRMGSRSSTRYGPASVFTGPVRKWRKRWIPIPSSSSASTAPSSSSSQSSKLSLYRWTSLTNGTGGSKDDAADDPSPTPPRKIRYVPVSVIEEQRKEAAGKTDEEGQGTETAVPPNEDTKNVEISMAEAVEPASVDGEAPELNP